MIRTKSDAMKALHNVDSEKVFWVCDGTILRNIKDLHHALKFMHPDSYGFHANPTKNDFSKWLSEVLGDQTLAKRIVDKSQKEAENIVAERIVFLEKKIRKAEKKRSKKTKSKPKKAKKTSRKKSKSKARKKK